MACWRGLDRRPSRGAALLLLGLLCGAAASSAQEAGFFRIGTGATGGTFFELGGVIAGAISKPAGSPPCEHGGSCGVPGLVAVAQATQGTVENLRLIASGQSESGIAQADIASWACNGTGVFAGDGPMKRLRAIASLVPESFQLVVAAESPIQTLTDLKGKRVSLGEEQSGTLADGRLLLAAAGLTENDVTPEYIRPGLAAEEIKAGTLDAFFLIGGFPVPAIRELAAAKPIRLIPIGDDILAKMNGKHRSYSRAVIPADSYPDVGVATPSIGTHALWVVSADVADDLVYAITKALWNEATQRLLEARNPAGKEVRLVHALDGVSLPLHPGALRFYREAGLSVEGIPAAGPD